MTDEQQPDVRWAPMDPAPSNRWRIWLIVGLIAAGLVVAVVLVLLLLPRGDSPEPAASPSASPSASATASPSAEPTAEPEPSAPVTTPPPAVDPTVDAFRGQVQVYLDDALVGLDIVSETSGDEALAVIETLEADVQRMSETAAPSSIAAEWSDALSTYSERLADLRGAVDAGGDASTAIDAARAAAESLRDIVGL